MTKHLTHSKIKNALKYKIRCPYCDSILFIKRGLRKLKRKKIQRFKCLECHKTFSRINIDKHMRNSKQMIKKALKLRKTGLSFQQIADQLNNKVSRQTIYKWCKKFHT